MRITLKSKENPHQLMRRCGYYSQGINEKTGELVFVRQLGSSGYPRFHIYARVEDVSRVTINLHLDQKKPIYRGATAHAGEYEGKVVEKEIERIKTFAKP